MTDEAGAKDEAINRVGGEQGAGITLPGEGVPGGGLGAGSVIPVNQDLRLHDGHQPLNACGLLGDCTVGWQGGPFPHCFDLSGSGHRYVPR